MTNLTFFERFCMRLLHKTHWLCISCGDFHRYDYSSGECPRRSSNPQKEKVKK